MQNGAYDYFFKVIVPHIEIRGKVYNRDNIIKLTHDEVKRHKGAFQFEYRIVKPKNIVR